MGNVISFAHIIIFETQTHVINNITLRNVTKTPKKINGNDNA